VHELHHCSLLRSCVPVSNGVPDRVSSPNNNLLPCSKVPGNGVLCCRKVL
jgi:hypothetical protein